MYNRYIPQPDGSFKRNRVPEPQSDPPKPSAQPKPELCPPPAAPECAEPPKPNHRQHKQPPSKQETSITGFLRQILPKGLDTGDLLIILLLLLMAGDCAEDQNTAMLTLAMYLFM